MNSETVRITLRIPRNLHAQAVELAHQMDRSLNWEMIHLLRLGVSETACQTLTPPDRRQT